MVFLTAIRWFPVQQRYKPMQTRYFKRMQFKRIAHRYHGRRRTCYIIGVLIMNRALRYSTRAQVAKVEQLARLHEIRLAGACLEHNMDKDYFMTALQESDMALDRMTLSNLSIYEPRSFQSLVEFVKMRSLEIGLQSANLGTHLGAVSRHEDIIKIQRDGT